MEKKEKVPTCSINFLTSPLCRSKIFHNCSIFAPGLHDLLFSFPTVCLIIESPTIRTPLDRVTLFSFFFGLAVRHLRRRADFCLV